MPFESGTIGFRMFYMSRTVSADVVADFAENAIPPVDSISSLEPVYGWVTSRHLMDRNITEDSALVGGYLRLDLVEVQRKIPTALLQAEMKMEEMARLSATGATFIARKEKSEMKREISDRLLPQMPPHLKGTPFVYQPDSNFLYACALSDKQLDLFSAHFRHTAGVTPIPMTPENLALECLKIDTQNFAINSFADDVEHDLVSPSVGHDFLTWLWEEADINEGYFDLEGAGRIGLMLEGPLTFLMEGSGAHETTLRKGNPLQSAEAKACLMNGKKLIKAKITIAKDEQIWSFNFDAGEFIFRGLKLPEPEEQLDPLSRFQDRMLQLESFREIFFGLYKSFLNVRRDNNKWSQKSIGIRDWIKKKKSMA